MLSFFRTSSAGDLKRDPGAMSDFQTLASGAGAGFLTSVMTLLFTILGFHKRLEKIEQEKLNREIHDLCSTGILAQITELKRSMLEDVRSLGGEIKQLRIDTNREIRDLSHRIDRLAAYANNQVSDTNRDIRELTSRIDRMTVKHDDPEEE
jgi:hypothetical protein